MITAALALSTPVAAQATPETGSGTIAPQAPAPTFQDPNPATPPVIPYTVSYDAANGTLSVSVGGGPNTSNTDDNGNAYTGWFPLELYFSGPHIGELDNGYLDVRTAILPTGSGDLFDPGPGSMASTSVTESADGQTLTTTFANQLLTNIADNFVSINNLYAVPPSFYLSVNGPYTSLSVKGTHSIAADTPFTNSKPAATLSASLKNLAETDVNSEEVGGQLQQNYFPDLNPPSYTTTGLPPGLRVDSADAEIVGTPTKPGHYNSMVTATTYYGLGGKPSYQATLSYVWTVTPAPIPVALKYDGGTVSHASSFGRKPESLYFTGDGSAYYAGDRNGKPAAIHWTKWNAAEATARTYEWDRFYQGSNGRTYRAYPVVITLSAPVTEHGERLFTKLTDMYTGGLPASRGPRKGTMHVRWSYGSFNWGA